MGEGDQSPPALKLVVIDDEAEWLAIYSRRLSQFGFQVVSCQSAASGLDAVRAGTVDAVLLDLRLFFKNAEEEFGGLALLSKLRALSPGLPVIVISAFGSKERAFDVMRRGAFDFVEKPVNFVVLREVIERASLTRQQFLRETGRSPQVNPAALSVESVSSPPGEAADWMLATAGTSRAIVTLASDIERLTRSERIAIVGERGVGKEQVARCLHYQWGRPAATFIVCSTLRLAGKSCRSETPVLDKGMLPDGPVTLYLEGADELPANRAVGLRTWLTAAEKNSIVHFVLAVNALRGAAERLCKELSLPVTIVPPLRERRTGNDIALLVGHLLRKHGRGLGRDFRVSEEALTALTEHDYVGNIRELDGVIRAAVAGLADSESLIPLSAVEPFLGSHRGKRSRPRVFLCHNSTDKAQVKAIARRLKDLGISVWLDEWDLRPGTRWRPALEEQMSQVDVAVIFVASNGIGLWQDLEIDVLLRGVAGRGGRVIPAVLPPLEGDPKLSAFLSGMTWVDFRKTDPDPLSQLAWGITGRRPLRTRDEGA
jgi:DNA-binding NtrC family response regulator